MAPRDGSTLPALTTLVAVAAAVSVKLSAASAPAAVVTTVTTPTTVPVARRTAQHHSQPPQQLPLQPAQLLSALPTAQPRLNSRRPRLTTATSPSLLRPSLVRSADHAIPPIGDCSPRPTEAADFIDYYVQLTSTAVELVALAPCLVGNLLVVASFARFRRLRTRVNALVLNQAVADLLVGVVVVPFNAVYAFSRDLLHDERLCLALNASYALCFGGSLSAMLLISMDRYCAVSFPFFYGERMSRALAGAAVCLVWFTLVAVAAAPPLARATAGTAPATAAWKWSSWEERCEYALIYPDVYKITMATAVACEVVANVGMYLLVARVALRQQQRICSAALRVGVCSGESAKSGYGGGGAATLRRELGAARSMLVTNGLFIVCWSPYVATIILTGSNLCGGDACAVAYRLTLSLGIINSCINGVLCSCKKKDFRWAVKRLLRVDSSSDRRRRVSRLSVTAAVPVTGAGADCACAPGLPPPPPPQRGGSYGNSGNFARMNVCLRFRSLTAPAAAGPTQ